MIELVKDSFYKMMDGYEDCIIDYCIMKEEIPYRGERSHEDAIRFAMLKVMERTFRKPYGAEIACDQCGSEEIFPWSIDIEKAKAKAIDASTLFYAPKTMRTNSAGQRLYDGNLPDFYRGERIPYWYAFLEPPHTPEYGLEDFHRVNAALFPEGVDKLESYEWTTDWSNYFDAGHEWWGTACWSIYDKCLNRYVVIMASTTD